MLFIKPHRSKSFVLFCLLSERALSQKVENDLFRQIQEQRKAKAQR